MKFRLNQLVVFMAVIVLIIGLSFIFLVQKPDKPVVKISRQNFKKSNYHFIREHWKEEKLTQLRDQEDYKNIKESHQFKFFLKLCDWVHRQWKRSIPEPYPLCNAIDILRDIRSKKTGGFCGQYAYVLVDVLKSMGFFNVRYVELWSKNGKSSHFVVEAWCDIYHKWVILDPDYNIYYELVKTGLPANALEVRDSLFSQSKIIAKATVKSDIIINPEEQKHLYANFAVSLRSDLMRHNKPLTVGDRFQMFLFYFDKNTNPTFFGDRIPYWQISRRKDDLYFDCNYVRIEQVADDNKNDDLNFSFFTDGATPNFKYFSISKDMGKSWQPVSGNLIRVYIKDLPCQLLVAPVNMYNRTGCINLLSITL